MQSRTIYIIQQFEQNIRMALVHLDAEAAGKILVFEEVILTQLNEFMLYSPRLLFCACVFEGIFINV